MTSRNLQKHTNANPLHRWLLSRFHRTLGNLVEAALQDAPAGRQPLVLEVGCGEGFVTNYLTQRIPVARCLGVEPRWEALRYARTSGPDAAGWLAGDAFQLPLTDKAAEVVVCAEVLEHLADPWQALAELQRVCRGALILSVPNQPYFSLANFLRGKNLRTLGEDPEHVQHWRGATFPAHGAGTRRCAAGAHRLPLDHRPVRGAQLAVAMAHMFGGVSWRKARQAAATPAPVQEQEVVETTATVESTLAPALLGSVVALYAVTFAILSVMQHASFQTNAFDLGNMDQAVWNTLHGRFLEFTNWEGGNTRLAVHVEPILFLVAPFYALYSGPETLLVLQSVVLALGALPAFWLARRVLDNVFAAAVCGFTYLLAPALEIANLADFHAVAFSSTLLLFAFYYAYQRNNVGFFLAAVLAMATKEHVPFTIFPHGALHRIRSAAADSGLCSIRYRAGMGGHRFWHRAAALQPGGGVALPQPL